MRPGRGFLPHWNTAITGRRGSVQSPLNNAGQRRTVFAVSPEDTIVATTTLWRRHMAASSQSSSSATPTPSTHRYFSGISFRVKRPKSWSALSVHASPPSGRTAVPALSVHASPPSGRTAVPAREFPALERLFCQRADWRGRRARTLSRKGVVVGEHTGSVHAEPTIPATLHQVQHAQRGRQRQQTAHCGQRHVFAAKKTDLRRSGTCCHCGGDIRVSDEATAVGGVRQCDHGRLRDAARRLCASQALFFPRLSATRLNAKRGRGASSISGACTLPDAPLHCNSATN